MTKLYLRINNYQTKRIKIKTNELEGYFRIAIT